MQASMQAYSLDLRERVVAACERGEQRLAQVAGQFRVSIPFISQLLRGKPTTGLVAALPHRSGPAPLLGPVALQQLTELLHQQGGPAVSRPTLGRAVVGLHWRRAYPRPRARHGPGKAVGS